MRTSEQIKAEIEAKFGFFPPFFSPALQNPQVLENLWQQTLNAYVNNPLSALFKEKLSAYLSRFCGVPYCMVSHSCTLRPLDMRAQEVLQLLESPPPTPMNAEAHLATLKANAHLLPALPEPHSPVEEALLYCAIFIALEVEQAEEIRIEVRRLLGAENYQHLAALIAYVKTCHVWMEANPEVSYEADQRVIDNLGHLVTEEPGLVEFFRNYREKVKRERQNQAVLLAELAERQRNEAILRQSEERLRLALDAARMGTWDWNILTNQITWSDNLEALFGFEPGTFAGNYQAFINSIHPQDREFVQQSVMQAVQQGREYDIEFRIVFPDGTIRWAASKGQVFYDDTARPVRMAGIDMDITKRKQMEAALREGEERWQLAVRGNNDGIWDWNVKTNEVFFSTRWKEMLGYEDHEISNDLDEWEKRVHPDDIDWVKQVINDHFAKKTPFYITEHRVLCKDGTYKWILARGQAFWDEAGNAVRMTGSHTNHVVGNLPA